MTSSAVRIAERAIAGGAVELPIVLIGAGGHARVVWSILLACGRRVVGATDADPALANRMIGLDGPVHEEPSAETGPLLRIIGDDASIPAEPRVAIAIGVGVQPSRTDPGTGLRRRLHERFADAGFECCSVIDPSAILRGRVEARTGCQVMAGTVIQTGSRICTGAVINSGATVDHDCVVGEFAFVAPGAVLCGGVTIGEGAFVGAGATILPGVTIGAHAVVRAGATISRSLAAGELGL